MGSPCCVVASAVVTSERSDSRLICGHWPHTGQVQPEFALFPRRPHGLAGTP